MLRYPTLPTSTLHPFLGYPSALSPHCRLTVKPRCARKLTDAGRWITFDSGVEIYSGRMHTEARYPVSGKKLLGRRSGLVLVLRCLLENGNSKKFSQYFLSKLSFDKLSWVFAFCLGIFFGFLSKLVFQDQVSVIME